MEDQNYEDKDLVCRDCKATFVFRAKDQEFYARMEFKEPKRCKRCRDILKASRDQA